MHLLRCHGTALVIISCALAFSKRAPAEETRSEIYLEDIDFLLAELPKKAGHFFPVKGVDWSAVAGQFRYEVKTVTSDVEHVKLCNRLLARLRDGHASLRDLKVQLPDESRGRRWTGPRVHLVVIGEKVFVRQAFGTAAQEEGIKIGMEVVNIDSMPAREWLNRCVEKLRDERGYSTPHQGLYAASHWGLADWEGTEITFDLQSETAGKRVTIRRQGGPNMVPVGPVFAPKDVKTIGRQSYGKTARGFGYIHLRDVPGTLPEQLDTILETLGDVPGIILDLRANGGGGCDHTAVFGRFVPAGTAWRQYPGAGKKPFGGPLVVIADAGTRSAGETVAGMFKEDGRAYMIGDTPTAGTSSQKELLPVPSGLFSVYFSVASNKGRFNNGRGIEGLGVPPHETVPYDPSELARAVDTQIRRAEELLTAGLPKDKVAFQPAK